MQDSKETARSSNYDRDVDLESGVDDAQEDASSAASKDADGWQKYRRWISSAPAPDRRGAGLDPSLYTWKGYRSWTEQVKRDWDDGST